MALIEAVPLDLRDMLGLFPEGSDTEASTPLKAFIALNRLTGSDIPGPEGTTVRYEGMIEFRGADIPPVLQRSMAGRRCHSSEGLRGPGLDSAGPLKVAVVPAGASLRVVVRLPERRRAVPPSSDPT